MYIQNLNGSASGTPTTARIDQAIHSPGGRFVTIAVVFMLAHVLGLGSIGLWGIREKRVAACVADVAYGGQWLLPSLQNKPRLEKPPLPYWIIATFSKVAGEFNEWTLRLPGALAGLAILLGTFHLAREAGGPTAGLLAALFLCTSLFFVVEVRQVSSDLFLTCFTTCALVSWWQGYTKPSRRLAYWVTAGFCTGLGLLTKGPVALAVIAPPIIGLLVWQRQFRLPRTTEAWAGIAVALCMGLAWPLAVLLLKDNAWIKWVQELDRKSLRGGVFGRGLFYYVVQWPQYLFPWSAFAIAAARVPFRAADRMASPLVRFAWLWFFGDLIVFSLASGRKGYYLLPALPGLAVLCGSLAAQIDGLVGLGRLTRSRQVLVHVQFLLLMAMGIGLAMASLFLASSCLWPGVWAGGLWCAIAGVLWVTWRRRSLAGTWVLASALFACLVGTAYAFMLTHLDREYSLAHFCRLIGRVVPADAPIYAVNKVDPSFWFYLKDRPQPLPAAGAAAALPANSYLLFSDERTREHTALLLRSEVVLAEDRLTQDGARHILARTVLSPQAEHRIVR